MKGSQNTALLRQERVSLDNSAVLTGGAPRWSLSVPVLLCNPHRINQAPALELFSLPWLHTHTRSCNGFTGLIHSTSSEQVFPWFCCCCLTCPPALLTPGAFLAHLEIFFSFKLPGRCLSILDSSKEQSCQCPVWREPATLQVFPEMATSLLPWGSRGRQTRQIGP